MRLRFSGLLSLSLKHHPMRLFMPIYARHHLYPDPTPCSLLPFKLLFEQCKRYSLAPFIIQSLFSIFLQKERKASPSLSLFRYNLQAHSCIQHPSKQWKLQTCFPSVPVYPFYISLHPLQGTFQDYNLVLFHQTG